LNVTLISLPKPTVIEGVYSAQELIAYMARVSNPANQNNTKTAKKLLKSLIRDKHWSPLEMVDVCMEIKTSRDIGRQIIRHRSFVFQEFSLRYAVADSPPVLREARLQDTKNRQNSVPTGDKSLSEAWNILQTTVAKTTKEAYTWALGNGIAKEQARAVLSEGMTETTMFMKGSLRSWIHYCQLRMANGTQKEHMEIAKLCWGILRIHFKEVIDAVEELDRAAQEDSLVLNFFKERSQALYEEALRYAKIELDK